MDNHVPITVIVPTGNRVDLIEDCLQSVSWADELLVVDSLSSDGTMEIAEKYADRILIHEYGYSARQKNWAIPQAKHEWVLIVDTDERISPALAEEIRDVTNNPRNMDAFRLPRLNYMLGEPVRNGGDFPDYQIRLFRRDHCRYQDRRVHAHLSVDGAVGTLAEPIIHYAQRSVNQVLGNLLLQMTDWEAEERLRNYPRPFVGMYFTLLLRPFAAFLLRFFWKGGWRSGYRGLISSLIWAIYIAITYMKIWEKGLDLSDKWWQDDWQLFLKGHQTD